MLVGMALLSLCGASGCDSGREPTPANLPPQAAAGLRVFNRLGCATCHSFQGRTLAGPPLDGIYGQEVRLLDGSTVTRDDAYLERSILDAAAEVVHGYRPTMINYGSMLQEGELQQLQALIRFHSGVE